jgi:hypothetical protein
MATSTPADDQFVRFEQFGEQPPELSQLSDPPTGAVRDGHADRRRRRVLVVASTLIGFVGAVMVTGCETGPDEVSSPVAPASTTASTTPDTTVPAVAADRAVPVFAALFSAVPNDPAYLGDVAVSDLDAATAAAGTTRPEPGAPIDGPATETWLSDVFVDRAGPQPQDAAGFESSPADFEAWRSELGFSLVDTSASAMFTEPLTSGASEPPKRLLVYDVDVDTQTIDDAVRSDPVWSTHLVDKQAGGTPYYFWTEDDTPNWERATPVRTLGQAGTMAVVDGLVIRALFEDQLVAAITASDDNTLADRPDVVALLTALDPYAPYDLRLTNEPWPMLDELADAVPAPLRPYALAASAHAMIDGQRTTIVTFLHHAAGDADDNARRLERNLSDGTFNGQPWSELFESWTVTADGPLVIAEINEATDTPARSAAIHELFRSQPA